MDQISKDFFINDILLQIPKNARKDAEKELYKTLQKYQILLEDEVLDDIDFKHNILENFALAKRIEGKSDGTIQLYKLYINDFFDKIKKPLNNIASFDIRNYLNILQEERKISNRTLDSRRSCIHSFLN